MSVQSISYLQLSPQFWKDFQNKLWTLTPGMMGNYFKTPHKSHVYITDGMSAT